MAKPKFKFTDRTYTAFVNDDVDPDEYGWGFSWWVGNTGFVSGLYDTGPTEITVDQSSATADADRANRIINYTDGDINSGFFANSLIASNRGWYDIDEPNGGALVFGGNDRYTFANGIPLASIPEDETDMEIEQMVVARHTAGVTGTHYLWHNRYTDAEGGIDGRLYYDATAGTLNFNYGASLGPGNTASIAVDLTDAGYHLLGGRAELSSTSPLRYTIYATVDGTDSTGVVVGVNDPTVGGNRLGANTSDLQSFGETNITTGFMQAAFTKISGKLTASERAAMVVWSQETFSTP
jgi:hypothetical protein